MFLAIGQRFLYPSEFSSDTFKISGFVGEGEGEEKEAVILRSIYSGFRFEIEIAKFNDFINDDMVERIL